MYVIKSTLASEQGRRGACDPQHRSSVCVAAPQAAQGESPSILSMPWPFSGWVCRSPCYHESRNLRKLSSEEILSLFLLLLISGPVGASFIMKYAENCWVLLIWTPSVKTGLGLQRMWIIYVQIIMRERARGKGNLSFILLSTVPEALLCPE